MANDVNVVQDGKTAYVWGGWDASGFHSQMQIIDLVTGAVKSVPVGPIRFLAQGFVTNQAWNWVAGKLLYQDANGAMTQERPTTGPATILGIAYSAKTICLDPLPPKEALGFAPEMWGQDGEGFFTDEISDYFR